MTAPPAFLDQAGRHRRAVLALAGIGYATLNKREKAPEVTFISIGREDQHRRTCAARS
jgi:hypothetical protein